jgi:uncharacterized membrane protein
MGFGIALARIIHVLGGVIWVGSMFFISMFLIPSMTEAGPESGKVMAALTRRKFMIVIPIIAILTMLSGLWLYWRASMGFNSAYMSSGPGRTYALGATMAILGFIIGMTITRPAMVKVSTLMAGAGTASPAERERIMAEVEAARAKGGRWGRVIAFLLIGAATLMALGRYV